MYAESKEQSQYQNSRLEFFNVNFALYNQFHTCLINYCVSQFYIYTDKNLVIYISIRQTYIHGKKTGEWPGRVFFII